MKAPTHLRTERGHFQCMKLSVLNSTSRHGRVASLTSTPEALEDFHDQLNIPISSTCLSSLHSWNRLAAKSRSLHPSTNINPRRVQRLGFHNLQILLP